MINMPESFEHSCKALEGKITTGFGGRKVCLLDEKKITQQKLLDWGGNGVIETKDGFIDIPPSLKIVDKNTVDIVTAPSWEGMFMHRITRKDVDEYYREQAGNILSGLRTIGSIVGDWRMIDNIASEIKFIMDRMKEVSD